MPRLRHGPPCVAFHFEPALVDTVAGDLSGVTRTDFPAHRTLSRPGSAVTDVAPDPN